MTAIENYRALLLSLYESGAPASVTDPIRRRLNHLVLREERDEAVDLDVPFVEDVVLTEDGRPVALRRLMVSGLYDEERRS